MAKPTKKKTPPRPSTTFEPKGYEPKRIFQKIRSENLFEALDLDPKLVPWMYLENVITRSFARIVAQGPKGPVITRATAEGALAVVSRGGAFDAYERLDHTYASVGDPTVFTFSRQMERVDIFTYNGLVDYQLTRDAVQPLGALIPLFADSFYSLDFNTLIVKGTCVSFAALTPTRSTIFGWYRLEG